MKIRFAQVGQGLDIVLISRISVHQIVLPTAIDLQTVDAHLTGSQLSPLLFRQHPLPFTISKVPKKVDNPFRRKWILAFQ